MAGTELHLVIVNLELLTFVKAKLHTFPGSAYVESTAYRQPIDRAGLAGIFGKKISRDLISRLGHQELIPNGPPAPRLGAQHTLASTLQFLATFDLQTLRDLPELHGQDELVGKLATSLCNPKRTVYILCSIYISRGQHDPGSKSLQVRKLSGSPSAKGVSL
ncbi:MAG: hypothetical protein F4213_04455 [Boseongicola sp. SB0677_bin_26]|nr:hypothetical protein [Boseongicola sp. SB0665_bin_10]MYG25260.1 hypothetical protein [Boseongicola sp. SB0677_bin_26]